MHPRTVVLRQLNYTTRLLEEMMMVLVDSRRKTCHTLVLNYLVVGGGFKAFLDQFQSVIAWLWKLKASLGPQEHLLKQLPEEWAGGASPMPRPAWRKSLKGPHPCCALMNCMVFSAAGLVILQTACAAG